MLDAIIARLQQLQSFNVHAVNPDGSVSPWYEVTGDKIVPDLVIQEADVLEQVQTISARIMHWGRMAAQCKRVWDITCREYRVWRDKLHLEQLIAAGDGKKPTDKVIQATIRAHDQYPVHYMRMERAEEAYNAATAVLDGFRAKKGMLTAAAYRRAEDGAAILSI